MSGLLTTDPAVRALTKQSGYWRDLDWILLIAALATTILGSMLVWSASRADMASADDPQSYLKRHVVNKRTLDRGLWPAHFLTDIAHCRRYL